MESAVEEQAIGRSGSFLAAETARPRALCAIWAAVAALALGALAWTAAPSLPEWPSQTKPQWMRASWNLELRRLVEGERAQGLAALPPAGGGAVQMFQYVELPPRRPPPGAVLLPAVGGRAELYVNGAPIYEPAEASAPHLALSGTASQLVPVPREYWTQGRNRIDLVVSHPPARALATAPVWGSEPALRAPAERWGKWTRRAHGWAAPLGLASAALCFLAFLAGRGRSFLVAGLGTLALGVRALIALPEAIEVLGPAWAPADASLLAASLAAGTALVARRGRSVRRSSALGSSVGTGAVAGVAAATALLALWGAAAPAVAQNALALEAGYAIGVIALTAAAAGAGASATVTGARRWLREHVHLSRLVRRQRQELDHASHALQEEMRRRAILEERQRLARDMHDGIGGQLVSLIARVRAGRIGVDEVETALAEGLIDLRLIVDSLDSAGDSLAAALSAFEHRARAEIEAAGMRFVWVQPDDLSAEARNPRWVLDLYRFLQEAVSNAVRHSHAARFEVEVASAGTGEVTIQISDDGLGIPDDRLALHGPGKGLINLALRAKRLGGDYAIERGPGGRGTRISLRLPVPAATADHSRGEISPS